MKWSMATVLGLSPEAATEAYLASSNIDFTEIHSVNASDERIKRIAIAAWADPWSWSPLKYEGLDSTVESRSSLALITASLKPDRTLIIIQDTLLAANRARINRDAHTGSVDCNCISIKRDYPDPVQHINDVESYKEALKRLREAVTEIAVQETGYSKLDGIKVEISPGLGLFRYYDDNCERRSIEWRLHPDLEGQVDMFSLYQSLAILYILREMLELGSTSGEAIEVHLDLTHGVNYATTAIYRATLYASRLYSALTASTVKLQAYNSEPYTPGAARLRVWMIRREDITPKKAVSRLYYAYSTLGAGTYTNARNLLSIGGQGSFKKKINQEYSSNIGKPTAELQKIGGYAGASAFFGMPLLLLQAGYEADKGYGSVENIALEIVGRILGLLSSYKHTISIHKEDHLVIEHRIAPILGPLKSFLAALAMASYARKAWKSLGSLTPTGDAQSVQVKIGELDNLSEWIVGPVKPLVEREISLLKKAVSSKAVDADSQEFYKEIRYVAIKCREGDTSMTPYRVSEGGNVDSRILVAHSGFNKNLIEITCIDREPAIKYVDPLLDKIKEKAFNLRRELRAMLDMD